MLGLGGGWVQIGDSCCGLGFWLGLFGYE